MITTLEKKVKPANQPKNTTDLAINGAAPAFSHPLHVGSPNVGDQAAFFKLAKQLFDRNWLTNNGPMVQQFEKEIAHYHDVKHCIAMSNGTIALEIAIRAVGLEGEVIVPSYTFIATAHALHWQAITPVFADINPDTHCLDPESVRKMITPRTTGIIGVHLWGQPAQLEGLQQIAKEHKLKLLFDAAHAFGCSYKGQMIGSFGECEILSFHATKVLNTFEGGAILTNNDELAEKMRLMRNFGFSGMDNVIHPGTNGKMIEIAAAMGLVNLSSIEKTFATNYRNYQAYKKGFSSIPHISIRSFNSAEKNNYHYIVAIVDKSCPISRDSIIKSLHAENILARRYFWPGCHKMKPYRELFPHAGLLLPNTEDIAADVIVLPTGTSITQIDISKITSVIKRTMDYLK